ncbi:hypothetical protein [Caballeronia sp. S22]|uniref:hypothetical protein n=1 Tax=Caballeronia sp. S22 TaxID=3137182 RepID=UPI0035305A3A
MAHAIGIDHRAGVLPGRHALDAKLVRHAVHFRSAIHAAHAEPYPESGCTRRGHSRDAAFAPLMRLFQTGRLVARLLSFARGRGLQQSPHAAIGEMTQPEFERARARRRQARR